MHEVVDIEYALLVDGREELHRWYGCVACAQAAGRRALGVRELADGVLVLPGGSDLFITLEAVTAAGAAVLDGRPADAVLVWARLEWSEQDVPFRLTAGDVSRLA